LEETIKSNSKLHAELNDEKKITDRLKTQVDLLKKQLAEKEMQFHTKSSCEADIRKQSPHATKSKEKKDSPSKTLTLFQEYYKKTAKFNSLNKSSELNGKKCQSVSQMKTCKRNTSKLKACDMTNMESVDSRYMKASDTQIIRKAMNEDAVLDKTRQALSKRPCSTYREKYPEKAIKMISKYSKVSIGHKEDLARTKLCTYREGFL